MARGELLHWNIPDLFFSVRHLRFLVDNATLVLYVIDHMFFALAMGIKTYFQKIADPADMASSTGVSFTINHIAAVVIPAALGLV